MRGKGIVLDEPSVVAIRQEGGPNGKKTIQAVGLAAKQMLGKDAGQHRRDPPDEGRRDRRLHRHRADAQAVHQDGASTRGCSQPIPRIIICVPCGSTQVERRAIRESALWRRRVAGVSDRRADGRRDRRRPAGDGSDRLDGGRHRRRHHRSRRHLARRHRVQGSVRVGGDKFDEAIINYIRRNYGMLIGEHTAEAIKKEIGSAFPGSEVKEMEVKGRNLSEGIPRSFTISSQRNPRSADRSAEQHRLGGQIALEQTPPELGADIAEKGMVLTGGGALLRDLDRLLMEETGLPVIVAEDPLTCVVRGSGVALENMDQLVGIFASD